MACMAGDGEGHLCEAAQLIALARHCGKAGIVCNNITPANLLLTGDGMLRMIDVGCDMVPVTQETFKRRVPCACEFNLNAQNQRWNITIRYLLDCISGKALIASYRLEC